jgi:hypothetical protein
VFGYVFAKICLTVGIEGQAIGSSHSGSAKSEMPDAVVLDPKRSVRVITQRCTRELET